MTKTLLWLAALAIPVLCPASTISFSGSFSADNQEEFFSLNAAAGTLLSTETVSYGGGVNAAGQTIAAGGFATELSLFDSTGQLIALDAFGGTAPFGCGSRQIDPSTQSCLDASLPGVALAAGNYTLVLTEQGNNPVGMLADGFSEDAQNGNDPSFTGTNAGVNGAMFLDPGNFSQRSNQWVLDIGGRQLTVTTAAPEPSSAMLLGAGIGLMGLAFAGRKRMSKRAVQ